MHNVTLVRVFVSYTILSILVLSLVLLAKMHLNFLLDINTIILLVIIVNSFYVYVK